MAKRPSAATVAQTDPAGRQSPCRDGDCVLTVTVVRVRSGRCGMSKITTPEIDLDGSRLRLIRTRGAPVTTTCALPHIFWLSVRATAGANTEPSARRITRSCAMVCANTVYVPGATLLNENVPSFSAIVDRE